MPSSDDIAKQIEILAAHRSTLAEFLRQQALLGIAYAPPGIANGIRASRAAILNIKVTLRGWGVDVEDLPDDEPHEPVVPTSAAEQAGAAFRTVAGLMSAPDIRADVMRFQESFGLACSQIDLLSIYKGLHDLLHDLEFKCYRPIMIGTKDFPNNLLFLESLNYHEADLQEIVNRLWELADAPTFPANERMWIAQLAQTADLLRDAMRDLSKAMLDRATFQFERVLNIHPTRINECLKGTARNLPLDSLIKAIGAVRQRLAAMSPGTEQLAEIDQGIAALEQTRASLARLIDEHDAWQQFDPALRGFENNPEQHIQQLEWLWQDLKPVLLMLCGARSDRWTQDLQQAGERLDRAIAEKTADAISRSFQTFHSRFSLCFLRADKELKEQCFKLRLVDGPLKSVMGMMA